MFQIYSLCQRVLDWRHNLSAEELQGAAVLLALCLAVLVVFNKRS